MLGICGKLKSGMQIHKSISNLKKSGLPSKKEKNPQDELHILVRTRPVIGRRAVLDFMWKIRGNPQRRGFPSKIAIDEFKIRSKFTRRLRPLMLKGKKRRTAPRASRTHEIYCTVSQVEKPQKSHKKPQNYQRKKEEKLQKNYRKTNYVQKSHGKATEKPQKSKRFPTTGD
jgi:hypothetical protein